MALALAPDSAAERVLRLRMRPDLAARPQHFGAQRYWAVKDPMSLKYFHLREEEYLILSLLDGRTSLDEVRSRCNAAFAPRKMSNEQLHGYLATLHRCGLVLAEAPGQGQQMLVRGREARRRRLYEAFAGVLAIRFRGINPAPLLDWLYPKAAWIFSPLVIAAALILSLAALLLVAVEFDTFMARLPDFHAIVGASNLPLLVVALAVVKVLHELGHALACRRLGADCHEIGIILLVFTPSLYCNVSDSWMLDSKWRRIAISAAGIYVELILATVCTFLWWTSAPGILNSLCLNTMLICSLGTVMLNGNPLLRYDGYYILSDLVEVPNLSAQAAAALRRLVARWCFGIVLPGEPMPARRQALLAGYALASTVYRWIVVIAILMALRLIAREYHLEPLVALLAGVTLGGMLLQPVTGLVRMAREPALRRRTAPARVALTAALAVAAVTVVLLVPMPMRVDAPLVVDYRDAERVYVTVGGTLEQFVPVGQPVKKGQLVAQLRDAEVELEVARLRAQRDQQQVILNNLEARRLQGVDDGASVPAARATLADVEQRLAQLERDSKRLTIAAPCDGTVLSPPNVPRHAGDTQKLAGWAGTPLEDRNRGSYLEPGTLVALIGQPERCEAVLHVAQSDVELVAEEQRVRMVLDHLPGKVFEGRVVEIAKLDLELMPRELAAAGDVPSRTDQQGARRPIDTWYQARVRFDEEPPHQVARMHGSAKINVAPRSLGAQLMRYLRQTFSQ